MDLPSDLAKLDSESRQLIIGMATRVVEHQAATDRGELALARRGQALSFALCVFFGLLAGSLTLAGHDAVGGTIAGTTIVSVATVFILGRARSNS